MIIWINHIQYFIAKFPFGHEIGANKAENNKEIILKTTQNFIFCNWQDVCWNSKIGTKNIVLFQNQLRRELCFWKYKISLRQYWTKNIVLFQNQLRRELCFWKYKISLHFRVLEFQQQEITKKWKKDFVKNLDFLAFFHVNWIVDITFEVRLR